MLKGRFTGTPFVSLFLLLLLFMGVAVLRYPFEPKWDELPVPGSVASVVFFDADVNTGIYRPNSGMYLDAMEHVVVCEGVEVFRFYCGGIP